MLLTVLMISLITIGIFVTTWENMIFYKPAKWLKSKLPEWLHKPLFSCPICMASFWTLFLVSIFDIRKLIYSPIIILLVAGLNTIFLSIYSHLIPDDKE